MSGYQEILTDPSYARQIVTLTYPHIVNTGTNAEDTSASRKSKCSNISPANSPGPPGIDDRATPGRETRTEIMRRSFEAAVASLRKQFGDDLEKWRWGNINRLEVASLTRMPELSRDGGPTVGTEFTVNPGSNVGSVGGGASWRMIVDIGHPDRSVGIYPGGQSENSESPPYPVT